jgi:hypothetical protein
MAANETQRTLAKASARWRETVPPFGTRRARHRATPPSAPLKEKCEPSGMPPGNLLLHNKLAGLSVRWESGTPTPPATRLTNYIFGCRCLERLLRPSKALRSRAPHDVAKLLSSRPLGPPFIGDAGKPSRAAAVGAPIATAQEASVVALSTPMICVGSDNPRFEDRRRRRHARLINRRRARRMTAPTTAAMIEPINP